MCGGGIGRRGKGMRRRRAQQSADLLGLSSYLGREESTLYAVCAMRGDKSPPAHQYPELVKEHHALYP